MAENKKPKLVSVKIGEFNVTIGGKVHKGNSTVDLPEDQAKVLVEGEHATETEAPKEAPKK